MKAEFYKNNIMMLFVVATVAMPTSQAVARGGMMTDGGSSGSGGRAIFVGAPSEDQCRNCHEDLTNFPMLNDSNPNKHHLLIGTDIIQPTAPPNTVLGDYYTCLTCHPVVDYNVSITRDCLQCHLVETVTGSPMRQGDSNRHHQTDTFANRDCGVCHNN